MSSRCLDRVYDVLDQWKNQGMLSEWAADHAAIQFKDRLFGTGRFTNVIEILGPNVKITVRLFAGIEGDDRSVKEAFAYLLHLPYLDATVTIQRDNQTGNVGASVTFPCASNRHQLEVHIGDAVNTLTTYLEAHYDRIVVDLLELGVSFKQEDKG